MVSNQYTVINPNGIDVRTITRIVNTASEFTSKINFIVNNNEADAKSIINLMALNIKDHQELMIKIDGDDEKDAMAALVQILEECQII